jgi:hypothetical protein
MHTATNVISRSHHGFDCIGNGNKEVVNTMTTLVLQNLMSTILNLKLQRIFASHKEFECHSIFAAKDAREA